MSDSTTGSELICRSLVDANIDVVVGIPGTQTAPLDRAIQRRDDLRYVMARHETAVPHVAWGYYEAAGSVAATLTIPGPGETNAMHGLKNALEDCVPIVHLAAETAPDAFGKKPIHEIEPETYDTVVKANYSIDRPAQLPIAVAQAVATATTPPYGPVRLGVPDGILAGECPDQDVDATATSSRVDVEGSLEHTADLLAGARRPVVYVGGGARRSPDGPAAVRTLVDALGAPVVSTLKGKGVVPDTDGRVLGVSASHLPAGGKRALERADVVLALGTDFDGVATDDWSLPMGETLVHVTLDPDDVDAGYESDVAILGDVATVCRDLCTNLDERRPLAERWNGTEIASAVRREYRDHLRDRGLLSETADPAKTPAALLAIREALPAETIVTTDVGGFRLWAKQLFEAAGPDRYVTAGSWAGMGVGLPAAIGAKLARPDRPVCCLSGDGSLLMCLHELHTAAEYDLDITLVVFNNHDYGVISETTAAHADERPFSWDSPSFTTIAEGFGWNAVAASTTSELREAVQSAQGSDSPTLVDLAVDPDQPSAAAAAGYESTLEL